MLNKNTAGELVRFVINKLIKERMTEGQKRTNTIKYINGHWYGKGLMEAGTGVINADLRIDEDVQLLIFINGKAEKVKPFSSTAHWVQQFLSFMDNPKFYIKYANENQLFFGELISPGNFNGQNRWGLVFNRIG